MAGTKPRNDKFNCDLCSTIIADQHNWFAHVINCHQELYRNRFPGIGPETLLKCCICNEENITAKNYALHVHGHRVFRQGYLTQGCTWPGCTLKFPTDEAAQNHVSVHWREEEFSKIPDPKQCPHCLKIHRTIAGKKMHEKTCLIGRTCKICGKTSSTIGNLKNHMQIHASNKQYSCDLCGKSFQQFSGLWVHKRMIHGIQAPASSPPEEELPSSKASKKRRIERQKPVGQPLQEFLCDVCGRDYYSKNCLARHKKNVHGISSHPRPPSEENAPAKKKAKRESITDVIQEVAGKMKMTRRNNVLMDEASTKIEYTRSATEIKVERVHCPLCKKDLLFKFPKRIFRHLIKCHEMLCRGYIPGLGPDCLVSCSICTDKELKARDFAAHVHAHLSSDHRYCRIEYTTFCQVTGCTVRCSSNESLEMHMKMHLNEDDFKLQQDSFKCQHCPYVFEEPWNLVQHNKSIQTEITNEYNCNSCDAKFDLKICLEKHKNDVHRTRRKKITRTEDVLECPHCRGTFIRNVELKKHLIAVDKEKNLTCVECGSEFKYKACLKVHNQVFHPKPSRRRVTVIQSAEGLVIGTRAAKTKNEIIGKPDQLACSECGQIFTDLNLHEHYIRLEKSCDCGAKMEGKPYECSKCPGLRFKYHACLGRHFRLAHRNSVNISCLKFVHKSSCCVLQKKCKLCGSTFGTTAKLEDHMKVHKAKKPRFSCYFCSSLFPDKISRAAHLREFHDNRRYGPKTQYKPVTKKDLPKNTKLADKFTVTENLKIRVTKKIRYGTVGLKDPCYPCAFCSLFWKSRHEVIKHMEDDHAALIPDEIKNMPVPRLLETVEENDYHPDKTSVCFSCNGRFFCRYACQVHVECCAQVKGIRASVFPVEKYVSPADKQKADVEALAEQLGELFKDSKFAGIEEGLKVGEPAVVSKPKSKPSVEQRIKKKRVIRTNSSRKKKESYEREYLCYYCNVSRNSRRKIIDHLEMDHGICIPDTIKDIPDLNTKVTATVKQGGNPRIHCFICDGEFYCDYPFRIHLEAEMGIHGIRIEESAGDNDNNQLFGDAVEVDDWDETILIDDGDVDLDGTMDEL